MTTNGAVEVPIEYRDGSGLGCIFRVEQRLASELIPTRDLEAIPFGKKAVAAVFGFEYRDTSIGAYKEVLLAILVRRSGSSDSALRAFLRPNSATQSGWYMANVPVTSEAARAAGVELWGFPKYIRAIDMEFREHNRRILVEGELEIQHQNGFGLRLPSQPMVAITMLNNTVLRTVMQTHFRARYGGASSVRMRILGDGPTARTAKKLGLDATEPFLAFCTDRYQSSLPMGTPL